MKIVTKKAVSAFLALAMIIIIISPVSVQAASKIEGLTLYVDEVCTEMVFCKSMSSVSSSSKSVATVKVDTSEKKYTITAKKAGTTTITVKLKDYSNRSQTLKVNVTVKKSSFSYKLQQLDGGYVLLSVKNNTKQTFDRGELAYCLKSTDGKVIRKETTSVYKLIEGKTYYKKICVGRNYEVDCNDFTAELSDLYRAEPEKSYETISSDEVTYKKVNVEKEKGKTIFDLMLTNTLNRDVQISYYVIAYDADDKIIDVPSMGITTIGKKENKTVKYNCVDTSCDSYKIVIQGFYITN